MASEFEEKLYNALYSVFRQWMGREPRQERLETLRDVVEKLASVLSAGSAVEAAEICKRMQPVIAGAFAGVGEDQEKTEKKVRALEKKLKDLEAKVAGLVVRAKADEQPPNMVV